MRERPSGWAHTLLADHLSSSDLKVEKKDFKMCLVLLCAGASVGDVIPVKSKSALHTVMALQTMEKISSTFSIVTMLRS